MAFLLGRALDGLWHATHDEFEGVSEQLEAHWLAWLGVLITLAAVIGAYSQLEGEQRNGGYALVLGGCTAYIAVAVWHFVEHANGADPELAHVLLVVTSVAIITGAALLAALHGQATRRAKLQ